MDQIMMEQITELLKAQIGGLASKMDSNQEKMEARMEADKAELMSDMKVIQRKMDVTKHKRKALQ
jgi:hypothetical protein